MTEKTYKPGIRYSWKGGKSDPGIHKETMVTCWLRGEGGWDGQTRPVYQWSWEIDGCYSDIMFFRIEGENK